MINLEDQLQTLLQAEPNPDMDYYAITILLGDSGKPAYTSFSAWVGFTDGKIKREIRQASLVDADRMLATWRMLEESAMVVDSPTAFGLFFSFGGHAVVEKQLAEAIIPDWLAPTVVVNVGEAGFASPGSLPNAALQRAPTQKLRMQILKRDDYRCRICGRRSSDHVDIELHVHHVRPWGVGGVTEESNLITLCHTCHNGLEPHFEYGLFALIPKEATGSSELYRKKLVEYQAAVAQKLR